MNNGIVFVEKETETKNLGELKKLLPINTPTIQKGILNNTKLLYPNEPARHKLLDLIGDISLANIDIKGKIIAYKPGHTINSIFTKKLKSEIIQNNNIMKGKPLMDINDIKKVFVMICS